MRHEKISGFSDEITEITKEQFEALNKFGIHYFEPRGIDGKNISSLTEEEMYDLKKLMDEYGIKVSSIGSPIGKIKVTEDFEAHFEVLKNVVKAAKILDTKYIRVFSFYHEKDTEWTEEERTEVFRRMKIMIDYAKEEDVILLHENEKHIYGDTADRCLELMKEFYGPNFKAIFDPANFVQSDEDTKRAYAMMKPYIAYMHIKDAESHKGAVVPAGHGDGNVEYILRDLFATGYDGFLSLEPHLGNFKGFADLEIEAKAQDKVFGGEEAFKLAHQSLLEILDRI
ncbi:MAG: sugar phosphate isomerase/epimerase [Tyzzerella sp.]|nr:sugar phosphate isomerase/epimerase [Tyzzerella sp.]